MVRESFSSVLFIILLDILLIDAIGSMVFLQNTNLKVKEAMVLILVVAMVLELAIQEEAVIIMQQLLITPLLLEVCNIAKCIN